MGLGRYFLSRALAALLFIRAESCNLGRGYYEEQFCEIILNLGGSAEDV